MSYFYRKRHALPPSHAHGSQKELGTIIAIPSHVIDSGTLLQGRFLIESQIGKGGMGAVYRAIDQKFGSLVAIKETFYGDTALTEAFEREARLLNGLHHPILPHVSDHFTENGGHFLVMQYIEGEDLSEILKRGDIFSVRSVMGWALDLLDGLDYLHSQDPPIIHRDIKPNNLKLTSRGKIVLLDFGMAKETSSTLEAKSVFGYSRRYSPLEQIEGSGTDVRSDIFSLGATVYHLLTGTHPVDVLARASAIVAGRPDPLLPADSINPEVPESVAAVLTSALALNPDNRFETARAMSSALEHAIEMSGLGNSAQHESPISSNEHVEERAIAAVSAATSSFEGKSDTTFPEETRKNKVVLTEESVLPAISIDHLAQNAPAFNARNELRRRLRSALPVAIPSIRIRRPSRLSYAVLLPLLLLALGLVLFGTYRGFNAGHDTTTATPESVSKEQTAEVSNPETPASEVAQPALDVASQPNQELVPVEEEDSVTDRTRSSIKTSRQPQRSATEKSDSEIKASAPTARAADRRAQNNRSVNERPRRVVRPAFEQPRVSSIEAIMTGVPYERRSRWSETDNWMEDDRRRRRLRRTIRENRYQYPF